MMLRRVLFTPLVAAAILAASVDGVRAQKPSTTGTSGTPPQGQSAPATQPPSPTFIVNVVETAPLPGIGVTLDKIPAPVQTASGADILRSAAVDLSDFLNRRLNGVHVNDIQNNPFQPDVNYRGYTASPLLGTPQGISVYMDGVRLNQPFGDVVSWDLIPRLAIASTTVMPGSNPVFGLNTLGGALSIQTKDGNTVHGTTVQGLFGSSARKNVEFEHGGRKGTALHWYLAGTLFSEDGWREASPSDVRQAFGKVGWQGATRDVAVTLAYADNSLNGNGLQETRWLSEAYSSAYTKPDNTSNRATFLNVTTRHSLSSRWLLNGNVYFRDIGTHTLNGDLNEASLDQAVYQPTPAERAALAAAGYTGVPASGANAENTPFPYWRCLGNVLLQDEPAEKCNGLINRTQSTQRNGGGAAQFTRRDTRDHGGNQLTLGGAYDRSGLEFVQSTELGYLNPDRSITGTGVFADGVSAGQVDGEPFDARVDLDGVVQTWSAYATDTLSVNDQWHLTFSGRYNETRVTNHDQIDPGGGPGSLDGAHTFRRFNPAGGLTFSPSAAVNVYGGYSEGSRAATSIELGCADPEQPCKLPNAMAGDPALDQVVTRTLEAGARGVLRGLNWNVGVFHADNHNDILFVTSEQTGFGYFRNFGKTRRQGAEIGVNGRVGTTTWGAGYTYLDATFRSAEVLNGEGNSSNDAAESGTPGVEGTIEIAPGDRLPLIPAHLFKAYADIGLTDALSIELNLVAASQSFARGNENNDHTADDMYYLGDGTSPGYAVVNLGATYQVRRWLQIIGQVSNLFNTKYSSAAQLGPMGFTDTHNFIARPFPPIGGEFPVRHATFLAPGAPIRAWVGARVTF